MATIYRPGNGEPELLLDVSLRSLQKVVGGYIETITLEPTGEVLVVNEEGKLIGLALNERATWLLQFAGAAPHDCVVGPAVLCEPGELE